MTSPYTVYAGDLYNKRRIKECAADDETDRIKFIIFVIMSVRVGLIVVFYIMTTCQVFFISNIL